MASRLRIYTTIFFLLKFTKNISLLNIYYLFIKYSTSFYFNSESTIYYANYFWSLEQFYYSYYSSQVKSNIFI